MQHKESMMLKRASLVLIMCFLAGSVCFAEEAVSNAAATSTTSTIVDKTGTEQGRKPRHDKKKLKKHAARHRKENKKQK